MTRKKPRPVRDITKLSEDLRDARSLHGAKSVVTRSSIDRWVQKARALEDELASLKAEMDREGPMFSPSADLDRQDTAEKREL